MINDNKHLQRNKTYELFSPVGCMPQRDVNVSASLDRAMIDTATAIARQTRENEIQYLFNTMTNKHITEKRETITKYKFTITLKTMMKTQ